MASYTTTNDLFLDVTAAASYSALDPDMDIQRGRKRRRNLTETLRTGQLHSRESSTLRGRCRHRSTSRLDASASRATSRVRGGSISPSRRKFLRVIQLNRQSPPHSRSPHEALRDGPQRRRHISHSGTRAYENIPETPRTIPTVSVMGVGSISDGVSPTSNALFSADTERP